MVMLVMAAEIVEHDTERARMGGALAIWTLPVASSWVLHSTATWGGERSMGGDGIKGSATGVPLLWARRAAGTPAAMSE